MRYMPPKNNKSNLLSTVLLIGGIIVFGFSFAIKPPLVFQLAGTILFVLSIQIMLKYILSDYVYIIDDTDSGEAVFNVIRAQGNRKITECSAELSKCRFVSDVDISAYSVKNVFNYKQNVFCDKCTELLYIDGDESSKIVIEADEAFIAELRKRI